ncbi:MAG: DEAD/DEAH box helicase [Salinivirgaceae bacterium]|nr:DEAD/DEAH box helicase [Salinivirgaceae bacterium]
MRKELIIIVTTHRKFGVELIPYIITPSTGSSLYSVIDKASPINIADAVGYCPDYDELIKLYGSIDDIYIARLFSKEPPADFLRHVDKEFIEKRIRPHIEIRLKKMLKLIAAHNLRLFYKDPKLSQIYSVDEITLAAEKSHMLFLFDRNENGIRYRIAIDHGDHYEKLKGKTAIVITDSSPCIVVINKVLYQFYDIDSKKIDPFLRNDFVHIRKETEAVYFEKFIINTVKNFKVRATGFNVDIVKKSPDALLSFENDLNGRPVLMLKFRYGSKIIFPNNPDRAFVEMQREGDNVRFVKTIRQREAEVDCVEKLKSMNLETTDGVFFYVSDASEAESNDVLLQAVDRIAGLTDQLRDGGFEIRQDFFDRKYFFGKIDLTLVVNNDNDWYDLKGTAVIGGYEIPFLKFRHNILHNIREYELPDGTIAVLPAEWFAKYSDFFLAGQIDNGCLKVRKHMFGLLHEAGISSHDVDSMLNVFKPGNLPRATIPAGLQATLRPYQLTGYYWMKLLRSHGFGGCLADDMGLGKTLQTLALLLDSANEECESQCPQNQEHAQLSLFEEPKPERATKRNTSLIVVPLSLIHNWQAEAARFAPSLKVLAHAGIGRARNSYVFGNYDIVLTTYGLVRNDCDMLSTYPFNYIILDESQAIKNNTSKSYASVIRLRSKYKLVLTGTPIENSLTDLWTQMNFINPGLLGSFQRFKTDYVSVIERDPTCNRSARLKALIEPFIMRRTKGEVAGDLPPKTEQVRVCTMESEQQILYEKEKSSARNLLLEKINADGVSKASAMVLQSLMRLRQIACHPKLAGFNEPSAKFDEVTRVLETILSENHKVLMFSSFVKYLNVYEEYLRERGIPYVMLTGETSDREQVIRRFQTDENVHVFLISLKAGGVGINLTAADYVFILDPWWNPSAENQAVDRAHRIGQTQNVFVYKFVTAGTLEEKIIALQNKKSHLADIFANSNPFKNFTIDEMMELFD